MSLPKPTLDDLRIDRKSEPEPSGNSGKILVVTVAIVLLTAGIWWWRQRPTAIEVHTAIARDSSDASSDRTVLNASGYVTARRQATVSAKTTGKVIEVLVEEGMKVEAGQILARLDDTNVKTSLGLAEAQLASARVSLDETRAQLKQANLEFNRVTTLAAQKIAAQSELEKAESDAHSLQARLDRQQLDITVAERQVAIWQQQLEDTIVRAPFAGVVTTKDAQPGEMISPISAGGGFTRTGICTIVDMASLEIEIDVNETYINRVVAGQPVEATLDAYPDWKIPCKVIAIIPTADRQKATVKVRVGFDQLDPRILPEMAVKVAFHEADGAAQTANRTVIIPKSAVQNMDGRDVVFVVQNNHAERRAVTVAETRNDDTGISAGVGSGEKIIVDSPPGLKDGASVKEMKP